MAIRVALADDSYLVREGIEQLLREISEVELVGSCTDLASLETCIQELDPDVVLTDIRMPPGQSDEGIQLAYRLRESHPETGVVVLSQYAEPGYVLNLFESGSERRGYLLKERVRDKQQLLEAIQAVREGGSVVDPKIVEILVQSRVRAERSPLRELTPREVEVLAAIAQGQSNTAIADDLVLTKRAVEKHINAIFLKLGLTHSSDGDNVSKRVTAALMYLADRELY